MIIVEGPDMIGKTWLANKLVFELNTLGYPVQYAHMSKPPQGFDYYWGYVNMMRRNVVMDRFHLGEIVYRPVTEGFTYQTPSQFALLQTKLKRMGAVVVLCHADPQLIVEQHRKQVHETEMFPLDAILSANDGFRECATGVLSRREGRFEVHVDIEIVVNKNANGEWTWPCQENYVRCIINEWLYKQRRSYVGL